MTEYGFGVIEDDVFGKLYFEGFAAASAARMGRGGDSRRQLQQDAGAGVPLKEMLYFKLGPEAP